MEYKTYNDKEELEYKYLKVFDFDFEDENLREERILFQEVIKNRRGIGSYDLKVVKVVKIYENKVIVVDSKRTNYKRISVFDNLQNFKEGETLILDDDYRTKIHYLKKVDDEILNMKYLEEQQKNFEKKGVRLEKEDFDLITFFNKENIKDMVEKYIKRKKKIKEEEEIAEVETEKEEEEKETNDEKNYREKNIYEDKEIKIYENKIENLGYVKCKYILKEDVNKIFNWVEFGNLKRRNYYHSSDSYKHIEGILLDREISFELQNKDENGDYIKKYDIVFERDKKKEMMASLENKKLLSVIKINGEKINRSKQKFILYRIKSTTTIKEIKLLNKLSGMKIQLLDLKKIRLNINNLELDMNINLIDDENFNVEFMKVKKKLSWDYLKHLFFYGGTSRGIRYGWNNEDMTLLITKLGINKQDFFDYLKKVTLLEEL